MGVHRAGEPPRFLQRPLRRAGGVLVRLLLLWRASLRATACWWRWARVSKGLELGALGQPGLLALHGARARLLDHLALRADGVVELGDEGAIVAPCVRLSPSRAACTKRS